MQKENWHRDIIFLESIVSETQESVGACEHGRKASPDWVAVGCENTIGVDHCIRVSINDILS